MHLYTENRPLNPCSHVAKRKCVILSKSGILVQSIKSCLRYTPVEPSLVVRGQDRLWASLLEVVNKGLQAVDSSRDELGTAERLQATVVL